MENTTEQLSPLDTLMLHEGLNVIPFPEFTKTILKYDDSMTSSPADAPKYPVQELLDEVEMAKALQEYFAKITSLGGTNTQVIEVEVKGNKTAQFILTTQEPRGESEA